MSARRAGAALAVATLLHLAGVSGATRAEVEAVPVLVEGFVGAHEPGYSVVGGGDELAAGAAASGALTGLGPLAVQLDLLGAQLGDVALGVGALRGFWRHRRGSLGASYARYQLEGGLSSDLLAAHAEVYEGDLLRVSLLAGYERVSLGDDRLVGELTLHITPRDDLAIRTGLSYVQAEIKQTRADIITRVEWALPWRGALTPTVYAQYGGNLLTKLSAGLVLYFGDAPLGVRERSRGLHGLRLH